MGFLSIFKKKQKGEEPIPQVEKAIEDLGSSLSLSITTNQGTVTNTLNEIELDIQASEHKGLDRNEIADIRQKRIRLEHRCITDTFIQKARALEQKENGLESSLDMYVKAVKCGIHAFHFFIDLNENDIAEVLTKDICNAVERILIVSKRLKREDVEISTLSWYRTSKYWNIACKNKSKGHQKLEERLDKLGGVAKTEIFEKMLEENNRWFDAEIQCIKDMSWTVEYRTYGTIHSGDRCKAKECKYCIPLDGLKYYHMYIDYEKKLDEVKNSDPKAVDKYFTEEPDSPPFLNCNVKRRNEWGVTVSLCDCWAEPIFFSYDLREQLKIIESFELKKTDCKHTRGEAAACMDCGLIMSRPSRWITKLS